MDHLLPIGRFSQLCRLSIKTLRYYDEIGLLKPAHIDPWTNYRYYTITQAILADQIRLLRATDMPLEEVR
jgi:DNA-binding transcriptional MerR regulator